jgi:hypothetical protein
MLLIAMIVLFSYIGGIFATAIIAPSFQINYVTSSKSDNNNEAIPQNSSRLEILEIKDCECMGKTYSDDDPPKIKGKYPPNGSVLLGGTTIEIEVTDNYPLNDFLPDQVLYNWDKGQSNTTIDEPPFEVVIPTEEGPHELYVYAGDNSGNWRSAIFYFNTTSDPDSVYIPSVSSTTTSNPPARRSPGFSLLPVILTIIGSMPIIIWKRRKQEF